MPDVMHISRSDFLRNGFRSLVDYATESVAAVSEKQVRKAVIPALRPPGAIDELAFLTACTRCDACITACPHDALTRASSKYGIAVDTPILTPADTPCYLCDGYPCIVACETSALITDTPVNIGTAHIIKTKCYAYNGQRCDYCYSQCPDKGMAIEMDAGKPLIHADQCNGCGMCEYLCPAPGKAVTILPDRPQA
jgi:MauM/NapG family ferredoxin protein